MNNINSNQISELDIFHTVYQLRKQRYHEELNFSTHGPYQNFLFRVYMVQTREQYEFLYKCILYYLEQKQQERKISNAGTAVSAV